MKMMKLLEMKELLKLKLKMKVEILKIILRVMREKKMKIILFLII